MSRLDFETLHEYLDDRYTPAEFIDFIGISMEDLIYNLRDYLIDNKLEELTQLTTEDEEVQLELELF